MRLPLTTRARLRRLVLLGTILALWQLLGACGSSPSPASSITATSTAAGARTPTNSRVPHLSHIAIVIMENQEFGSVIGNRAAPYLNHLADTGALATASYAVSHPSLPNYLALTGGSTFAIDSDCTDCHIAARNLVDELEAARISWKAYMQGMPRPCFTGASSGLYAKKHDPFIYYDDIRLNPRRCAHVVPGAQLDSDLAAGVMPRFAWITPNLCNDMHDCEMATGDRYLAGLIPRLIASVGRNGAVFVTWDEGSSDAGCCSLAAGGHIATVAAGGGVRPHARPTVRYDHYSLLRTIEDAWRLPELGYAGCPCTLPMSALLRSHEPARAP
jgi:phosphatidylinositol-3-phosphatase